MLGARRYLYLLVRSGVAPPAVAWLAYALVTSRGRVAPGYRCVRAKPRTCTAELLCTLSTLSQCCAVSSQACVRRWVWAAFAVLGTLGSQVWCYKLYRGLRKHSRAKAAEAAAKAA